MADHGEWNQKGATLSDVTAKTEYEVERDFIIQGIQKGKLEYRDASMWGNPSLRILRGQLEKCIAEEFGEDRLVTIKAKSELRAVKKDIARLQNNLKALRRREAVLDFLLRK